MLKRLSLLLAFSLLLTLSSCGTSRESNGSSSEEYANVAQLNPDETFSAEEVATSGNAPKRVALLLPISGPYAKQATAIRNGFFAAYYYAKDKSGTAPTIVVYDTHAQGAQASYQKAVNDGADFVVGPLTKSDVSAIIDSVNVPTLTLNAVNRAPSNKNLYQFGLSPDIEAQQAAIKARNDRHQRVIIISGADNVSTRLASTFQQQWEGLGGQVIASMKYYSSDNVSEKIRALLNIDPAEQRAQNVKQVLGERVRYIPQRRTDFDLFFLAINAEQAQQILPMLRFYYAGDMPMYGTSSLYAGYPNPNRDRDLDNVVFDDMPWVLPGALDSTLTEIQTNIQTLFPNSNHQFKRLYAFGVDAYLLIPALQKLSSSRSGMNGATGQLYLSPNQYVYRKLDWAKFVNGVPELNN